jgi:hypothetical protein
MTIRWMLVFYLFIIPVFYLRCGRGESDFDADAYLDRWVAMWNAYDLSQVDELFLTDARLTYISSERTGIITGIDAVRKHHEAFGFVAGGKEQPNRLWVDDIHAEPFGSAAVVAGVWTFQRGGETAGKVQRGPFTFVYIKQDGTYRIAHAHFANDVDDETE